jgi:YggT family protein
LCAAARAAKPAAMLYALFSIIDMILQVLVWIIIAQVIISWLVAFNVINTQSNFVRTLLDALDRMTAPLYRPIRKVLPDFGGIDFSPIVLILAIQILRKLNEGLALETSATVM